MFRGWTKKEIPEGYCPTCGIRLNMPPRYCCQVCEDSNMAAFERDRERSLAG